MTIMIEATAAAGTLVAHSPLRNLAAPLPTRSLGLAALSTWLFDAVSGVFMLGTWIVRGGLHQQRTTGDRLAPKVVFTHFGIATTGLLVWVSYLVTRKVVHNSSPVAAMPKCPRTTLGASRSPAVRSRCRPPRAIQVPSM